MQVTKIFGKKAVAAILAGTLIFSPVSIPVASADSYDAGYNIGAALGAGWAMQIKVNKQLKQINDSEEGRQNLYRYFREQRGVNDNPVFNEKLAMIMQEICSAVAKVDPTINEIPYSYFVAADDTVNAACSLGHVMMVNAGVFEHIPVDDEVAAIVAHEIGHGQKNHVIKSNMRMITKAMMTDAVAGGIAGLGVGDGAYALGRVIFTNNVAGMSKKFELEADNLAWEYMTKSDYNIGACAAVMQRIYEMQGNTSHGDFLHPTDHPDTDKRRDTYAEKLYEYSRKHVSAKNGSIFINGKYFTTASPTDSMSSAERAYLIAGNLAKLYHHSQTYSGVQIDNGAVLIGDHIIITPAAGDESAEVLAERLSELK